MHSVHELFRRHGLVRPAEGRILDGVRTGLGHKLGLRTDASISPF